MPRPLTRRGFLGLTGGVAALAGLASATGCGIDLHNGQTADLVPSGAPLPPRFVTPLPLLRPKQPDRVEGGMDVYEVVQRRSDLEILPGLRTSVFGYDGQFPGPLFDTRRGRPVRVVHTNELTVPTTVHLHGGHTPASSDGWPLDLVYPARGSAGASFPSATTGAMNGMSGDVSIRTKNYDYPLQQRASALWYHDHRMDFSGPQVYRGLLGMFLVRDDEEDALPLPRGDRELPLVLCDRSFGEDGSMSYPSLDPTLEKTPGVQAAYMEGVLGDVLLVNGAPWPVHEVEAGMYRLRVLNASNARRYRLALDPEAQIVQVGSDGGLLAAPQSYTEIDMAPGERLDLVVDFSGSPIGSEVRLANRFDSGPTGDIMSFRIARPGRQDVRVPPRLSQIEVLDPAKAAIRRQFVFSRGQTGAPYGWLINNLPFEPDRPQARPRLGDLEVWRFSGDLHHPVHVHLDPFQVVARNGGPPSPTDAGWKDTVDLRPAEYVDVAIRFTDHAGKYLVHCHNLEHEDMAMMAAFETVAG